MEIHVDTIFVVSKSLPELPFSVVEASKPGSMRFDEGELLASKDGDKKEEDDSVVKVGLSTRLNYRWITSAPPPTKASSGFNPMFATCSASFCTSVTS